MPGGEEDYECCHVSEFVFIVILSYFGAVFGYFQFEILACSRFFSSPQVLTMNLSTQIVITP